MTTGEAQYVIAHREMYGDATYRYALEILEHAQFNPRFDDPRLEQDA